MNDSIVLPPDPDPNWKQQWSLDPDVIYLNHGSFGPSPLPVHEARAEWSRRLEEQPMRFLVREMEHALDDAAETIGEFIGCRGRDLLFVPNATYGMNVIAHNVQLEAGDEVLLTDHEYGSVVRLWRRIAQKAGAELRTVSLPDPLTTTDEIVSAVDAAISPRTKLFVFSHVTSVTATVLPAATLCILARSRGVQTVIDGPHAPGMHPLALRDWKCDYYTASGHKWLSAPFGSGFLYVHPRHQSGMKPLIVSWGRSFENRPSRMQDEFFWPGTTDPAPFLAMPNAIAFFEQIGWDRVRQWTHAMARYARHRLEALFGMTSLIPDSPEWYGPMVSVPVPSIDWEPEHRGQPDPWMRRLATEHSIECPVVHWKGHRFVRVSAHLYNTREEIDRLVDVLATF